MASLHQPDAAAPGDRMDSPAGSENPDGRAIPTLRLRIAVWDVVCTAAIYTALIVLLTTTGWVSRLFDFADNVCPPDSCAPVPYGINFYIVPVMWAGIGGAIAAGVVGPLVSLLKGWYMSFWPTIAIAVLTLTSVAGYALTGFSERYWH